MRTTLIAAATLAVLASAALAGEKVNGTVQSYDATTHMLTLDDGKVYAMPSAWKDPGLKAGSKVEVFFDMMDGKHVATKLTVEK